MLPATKTIGGLLFIALLLTGWWMLRGSGHWIAEFSTEADKSVLVIHLDSDPSQRTKIILPQTGAAYPAARVTLDNHKTSLPRGEIVFLDNTIRPGRVIIEINGHRLDIMKRALIADGTEYNWSPTMTIELQRGPHGP